MPIKSFSNCVFIIFIFVGSTFAQTTAFNYQGKLTDGGGPANGNYQFQFKLFDALSGGTQIGATITDVTLTVTNGVFGTKLDFGANALSGANRWLEISVRRNSSEGYVTLAPREQIASSPYSVRTLSAASADVATNALNLGGVPANEYVTTSSVGSSFIRNQTVLQTANFNISGNGFLGGSFGVGTLSPQSRLSVFTPLNNYGLTHTDGTVTVGTYIGSGTGWLGTRSNHPLYFFTNDGGPQMILNQLGNVGIGNFPASMRLFLDFGPLWTSNGWKGSLGTSNGSAIGWAPNASGQRFGIGQSTGGLYFFRTNSTFGDTSSPANYDMIINDAGNVGIGTTNPLAKLQIAGAGPNGFTLGVEGNVTQNRDKGGFVKAMIYSNSSGTILRCYNGLTGSSSGNCGFTINHFANGGYGINFGFQVNDRFVSVSAEGSTVTSGSNAGANFRITGTNTVDVRTFLTGSEISTSDAAFMIIVF